MAVLNLSAVDAQCFQQPNQGGFTEILVCLNRSIEGQWPKQIINDDGTLGAGSSVNLDGEIISLPMMVATGAGGTTTVGGATVAGLPAATAKFVEYVFPIGTCSIDSEVSGDPSFMTYNHVVDLIMGGFSKPVRIEMRKLLNAGAVIIGKMKGGQYVVAGSSDDPIFLKASFKSGKKGGDKRAYTIKGNSDGMGFDLPVISETLIAQLPVQKF
jgi:hypothetical protein